jgi:hypothetical protein
VKDSLPLLAAAPAAQNKAAVANALAFLPHVGKGGQNEKKRLAGCGLSPTVSKKLEPKWLRAKSYAVRIGPGFVECIFNVWPTPGPGKASKRWGGFAPHLFEGFPGPRARPNLKNAPLVFNT